jgi:hypothetical protein
VLVAYPKKLLMSWVGRRELAAIVADARRWHCGSIHRVIELRSQNVEKQTKFFTLTVGHAALKGEVDIKTSIYLCFDV